MLGLDGGIDDWRAANPPAGALKVDYFAEGLMGALLPPTLRAFWRGQNVSFGLLPR